MALPCEMIRLATPYSLGLALELDDPPNRALCLTNKAFAYLLAGIPILFSRTPAQEQLAGALGEAAMLVDLDRPDVTAHTLDAFFADKGLQARARACAWRLGHDRYNWDTEKVKFLDSVSRCLNRGK